MRASLGLRGLHTSVFNICYRLSHHMQFFVNQSRTQHMGLDNWRILMANMLQGNTETFAIQTYLCLQIIRVKLKIEKVCRTFLKKWALRRVMQRRIVTNSHSLFRKEPRLPNLEHHSLCGVTWGSHMAPALTHKLKCLRSRNTKCTRWVHQHTTAWLSPALDNVWSLSAGYKTRHPEEPALCSL